LVVPILQAEKEFSEAKFSNFAVLASNCNYSLNFAKSFKNTCDGAAAALKNLVCYKKVPGQGNSNENPFDFHRLSCLLASPLKRCAPAFVWSLNHLVVWAGRNLSREDEREWPQVGLGEV